MLDVVEFLGSLLQELAAALGLCKGRLLSMSGGSCGVELPPLECCFQI